MKKVVIHLGYPKTGTTYLQEKIFPQASEFWSIITPIYENCNINPKKFKSEVMSGRVSDDTRIKVSKKPLLVSMEGFVFDAMRFVIGKNFCPTDLSTALQGLGSLCLDLRPSDITIVLVIRRQDHLIHSLYAESYAHQLKYVPELNTFEKYINAVLNDNSTRLDPGYYYSFENSLTEIRRHFPKSQIHIRFYEDLVEKPEGEIEFWRHLINFKFQHKSKAVNARSKTTTIKFTDKSGLRGSVVSFKTRYFPSWKLPSIFSRMVKSILMRLSRGAQMDIELTEEMRVEILRHFSSLNRDFFVAENIDMQDREYWICESYNMVDLDRS